MAPSARKTGRSRSPRRRNGTPLRWPTVRQVGWICTAAQGIEVKRPRNRCPLNWVVKFKRRPERRCVGRLSGFGLQYALVAE